MADLLLMKVEQELGRIGNFPPRGRGESGEWLLEEHGMVSGEHLRFDLT